MVWKCPPGYIVRSGYYRKSYQRSDGTAVKGTYVPPSCVKDTGAPGKGKKVVGPLEKGSLSRFGYHLKDTLEKRRASLKEAIKRDGALTVFHRVHALYVLDKRTNPAFSKKAKNDADWISRNYLGKAKKK